MNNLCKFSVLRYVPDLNREEFINIGVVLHSPNDGHINIKTIRNYSRILSFNDEVSKKHLKLFIDGISEDFYTTTISGPSKTQLNDEEYLEKSTRFYVNQFQFSPIKYIVVDDFEKNLEEIFNTYIYFDVPKHERINEEKVNSLMKKVFKQSKLDLPKREFDLGKGKIQLDFAYKNSNLSNLIKTFSFDYSEKSKTAALSKSKEWVYNYELIKKSNELKNEFNDGLNLTSLVFFNDRRTKEINTAIEILEEHSKVELTKSKREIEIFADKIVKEVSGLNI